MRKSVFVMIILIALAAIGFSAYVFFVSSKKVTISFNTNSDTTLESFKIAEGDSINLPTLEREGYTFVGWYVGDEKIDSSYKFNKNTILSAKWEKNGETSEPPEEKKTYTVTFDSNGGSSVSSQTIKEGEKAKKPSTPTKSNHKFIEWQLNGKAYNFNNTVTSDITLVAKWESTGNKKTYTVTFYTGYPNICYCSSNCNCPNGIDVDVVLTKTVTEGEKISKPTNPNPATVKYPNELSGYKFVRWETSDGKAYDFNKAVTSDLKLYSKWEKESTTKDTYTVTFNSNGGSNIPKQTVKKGATVTKPSDPARTDGRYYFHEWQLNGKTYDFNKAVTSDITLVADWFDCTQMGTGGSLKVKFNTNGGNKIDDLNICTVCGPQQVVLPTPTKSGYVFEGWYADSKLTRKVTGGTNTVNGVDRVLTGCTSSETTIYAKWTTSDKKVYTVTLVNNHVEPFSTMSLKYTCGTKINGLPTLSDSSNYAFIGWFDANNKQYKNGDTMPCNDLTLNAHWFRNNDFVIDKPLIYLYPEKEMNVEIKLGYPELFTTVYPKYHNGWNVKAYPNGKLIDNNTGRELYGLYWEGKEFPSKVTNEGFVVKGSDTIEFLEEKLAILGLNEREAEEFIIYWLPQMEHNEYNYIRFATKEEIDKYMPLEISPRPDTVIRIAMEFKPLDTKISVREQKLTRVERRGFTVVEWGGSLISTGAVK